MKQKLTDIPLTVCANNSSGVSPKNGTHPTRNSYNIIPIDHQSIGFPYPCLKIKDKIIIKKKIKTNLCFILEGHVFKVLLSLAFSSLAGKFKSG